MRCDHKNVHAVLGGDITIVGAIPEADAIIVGMRESRCKKRHRFFDGHHACSNEEVRGDVMIVTVSEDDEPERDLDTVTLAKILACDLTSG